MVFGAFIGFRIVYYKLAYDFYTLAFMGIDITSPPGPALSTDPKLEEDRSAPVLACCKPHPGCFRSLQQPFATSP